MRLIQFDSDSGDRIGNAVRHVEDQANRRKPLAFDPIGPSPKRVFLRICTFTGTWSKTTSKVVTFKYQSTTPNTVTATNLFANITATAPGIRHCAVARDGTAWYLVAAEC